MFMKSEERMIMLNVEIAGNNAKLQSRKNWSVCPPGFTPEKSLITASVCRGIDGVHSATNNSTIVRQLFNVTSVKCDYECYTRELKRHNIWLS